MNRTFSFLFGVKGYGCQRERSHLLFLSYAEPVEEIAQGADFLLVNETDAGLGYLTLEDRLVAGVAEQAYVSGALLVEQIFEGDVGYEVLREVLVGVRIGGVVASDNNLEPVVEEFTPSRLRSS